MPAPLRALDLPPVWLALFAALGWAQARWLPLGGPDLVGGWARPAGWAAIAVGVGVMVLAVAEMRRRRTTVHPHGTPAALAARGVFGLSRNPIYLGDALVLAGLCLLWQAVSGPVLLALFVALVTRRFIRPEEARLAEAFGADFAAYRARVRRWL